MTNGQHEEHDFDFEVDGQTFSKLFYLVDPISTIRTRSNNNIG
jgi:hypothetical protein